MHQWLQNFILQSHSLTRILAEKWKISHRVWFFRFGFVFLKSIPLMDVVPSLGSEKGVPCQRWWWLWVDPTKSSIGSSWILAKTVPWWWFEEPHQFKTWGAGCSLVYAGSDGGNVIYIYIFNIHILFFNSVLIEIFWWLPYAYLCLYIHALMWESLNHRTFWIWMGCASDSVGMFWVEGDTCLFSC